MHKTFMTILKICLMSLYSLYFKNYIANIEIVYRYCKVYRCTLDAPSNGLELMSKEGNVRKQTGMLGS